MDHLEFREQIEIFAYIFGSIGVVMLSIGGVFDAAAFGTGDEVLSVIRINGQIFQRTGAVCGALATILALVTR